MRNVYYPLNISKSPQLNKILIKYVYKQLENILYSCVVLLTVITFISVLKYYINHDQGYLSSHTSRECSVSHLILQ